jgi:hypothetical protein
MGLRSCFLLLFVAASVVTVARCAEARDSSRGATSELSKLTASTTTMFQKVLDVTPVFVKSRPGAFGLVAAGVGGGLYASLGWGSRKETGPTAACKALGACGPLVRFGRFTQRSILARCERARLPKGAQGRPWR